MLSPIKPWKICKCLRSESYSYSDHNLILSLSVWSSLLVLIHWTQIFLWILFIRLSNFFKCFLWKIFMKNVFYVHLGQTISKIKVIQVKHGHTVYENVYTPLWKIPQINFLIDQTSKILNFEIKYLYHFWAHRSEIILFYIC